MLESCWSKCRCRCRCIGVAVDVAPCLVSLTRQGEHDCVNVWVHVCTHVYVCVSVCIRCEARVSVLAIACFGEHFNVL